MCISKFSSSSLPMVPTTDAQQEQDRLGQGRWTRKIPLNKEKDSKQDSDAVRRLLCFALSVRSGATLTYQFS